MLFPFIWLWKQFNGPQVTAITSAIFTWLQNTFNGVLGYFQKIRETIWVENDGLALSELTIDHAYLASTIAGIAIPYIEDQSGVYWAFSATSGSGIGRGFASTVSETGTGVIRFVDDTESEVISVPDIAVRVLLKAAVLSSQSDLVPASSYKGEVDMNVQRTSATYLINILEQLKSSTSIWILDSYDITHIDTNNSDPTMGWGPGDWVVTLWCQGATPSDPSGNGSNESLTLREILQQIANTLFYPFPRLFFILGGL